MTPAPGSTSAEPDTAAAGADEAPVPAGAGLEQVLVSGLRGLRQGLSPFSRDVAGTAGTRILAAGLGFLSAALGARLLGPAGWGLFAVALALTALTAQFGNLGLHAANTYHVTRNPALAPALAGNSIVVSLLIGALAALLAIVEDFKPGLFPVTGLVLDLAFAGVPFLLAGILLRSLLLGLGDVWAYNIGEVLPPAAMLVMIVGMGLGGVASSATVVSAGVVGLAGGAVFSGFALRRHLAAPVRFSFPLLRTTFRFGARAYVAAFFSYALLRIDLLMVKSIAGADQAGLYSAAVSFSDGLYLVPTVMGAILFPRLVRLPPAERWGVTNRLTVRVAVVLTLAAVAAALVARPALTLVYGAPFADAVPAFRILAIAVIFIGSNSLLSNHLAAEGFPLVVVGFWGVAVVANVALNAVLIPHYGIEGAAVASLVCYAFMLAAQYSYGWTRARVGRVRGFGGGTSSPVRTADAVPLDRELLLQVGRARGRGVRQLAGRRPWLRIVGIDLSGPAAQAHGALAASLPSRLPFASRSFDCVLAGVPDSPEPNAAIAEICRVLREGGVFVSLLPRGSRWGRARAGAGEDQANPPDVRERFLAAGFQDVHHVLGPGRSIWRAALPPIVQAWKRPAPVTELERAREAMGWVYRRLEPGVPPDGVACAEDFLTAGRALCWGYVVALGELLRAEGFEVTWVTMIARGHPGGRGPDRTDSHEVLEVRADGRLVVLDPMCNTVIPCSLAELLAEPRRAAPKADPDERYRRRRYELYDTTEWYGRVWRVAVRRSPRARLYPWSWRRVRAGGVS